MEENGLLDMQEEIQKKGVEEKKPIPTEWNIDCIEGVVYGHRNTQHAEKDDKSV